MEINNYAKRVASISDLSIVQAKELLEALSILVVIDYMETGKFEIPLVGSCEISHVDDEVSTEGKKAILETIFTADPFLRKSIGQATDGTKTEAEVRYQKKIETQLNKLSKR